MAQQPATTEQTDSGRVSGVVIDVTTQEPLARVTVSIESSPNDSFIGRTDDEGNFTIENVPPGRYGIRLSRNEYVQSYEDSRGAISRSGVLDVGPGQVIDDLVLGLEPAAVITGRVLDEYGDPFEGLAVEALRFVYRNGSRSPRVSGAAKTNDQGEYRIYGLRPGDYYMRVNTSVIARATAGQVLPAEVAAGYVDVYYPNGYDASQARPLRVTGQTEATGIDFRMTPTRTFSVSGQVIDGNTGRPSVDNQAFLFDRSLEGHQFPISGRILRIRDGDGLFRAGNVLPGGYRLEVTTISADRTRSTAYYDFDLSDRSLEDVLIETRPTFSVPLVLRIEGEFDRPAGPPPLRLEPTGVYLFRGAATRVADNGEFRFGSVAADSYRVRAGNMPSGLYLKSARYAGHDALNEFVRVEEGAGEFEVVLSANGAGVEGRIARDGEGVTGAQVVVIPDDRQRDYLYKSAVTDQNGVFMLTAIAPGRYKVFAWERIEPSAWTDPRVLAEFEDQGVRVEVKEGDAKRITPKLIEAK